MTHQGQPSETRLPPQFEPDTALVNAVVPAVNLEPRRGDRGIDLLIMHYTGFRDGPAAIDYLARREGGVSCHYVVDVDGAITQMVPESLRAWHAGESCWHGVRDINSCSVGIEIQNPGHSRGYPPFPDDQMEAVANLARDIIDRNGIPADRVLAHSDIAPHRKMDPGELFDWKWLADRGVGHWVAPVALEEVSAGELPDTKTIRDMQSALVAYGYDCPISGTFDQRTKIVVTAFQRHFRPARVDGQIDASSLATLRDLLAARDRQAST